MIELLGVMVAVAAGGVGAVLLQRTFGWWLPPAAGVGISVEPDGDGYLVTLRDDDGREHRTRANPETGEPLNWPGFVPKELRPALTAEVRRRIDGMSAPLTPQLMFAVWWDDDGACYCEVAHPEETSVVAKTAGTTEEVAVRVAKLMGTFRDGMEEGG